MDILLKRSSDGRWRATIKNDRRTPKPEGIGASWHDALRSLLKANEKATRPSN